MFQYQPASSNQPSTKEEIMRKLVPCVFLILCLLPA